MKDNSSDASIDSNLFFFYLSVFYVCFFAPLLLIAIYSTYGPSILEGLAGGSTATLAEAKRGDFILQVVFPLVMFSGLALVLWLFKRANRRLKVSSRQKIVMKTLLVISAFMAFLVAFWDYIM